MNGKWDEELGIEGNPVQTKPRLKKALQIIDLEIVATAKKRQKKSKLEIELF